MPSSQHFKGRICAEDLNERDIDHHDLASGHVNLLLMPRGRWLLVSIPRSAAVIGIVDGSLTVDLTVSGVPVAKLLSLN